MTNTHTHTASTPTSSAGDRTPRRHAPSGETAYRPVVFRDKSAHLTFLTRSTVATDQTIEWEGAMYPLVDVEVSAESHPFWTGRDRVLDNEGRVERYRRRYGAAASRMGVGR